MSDTPQWENDIFISYAHLDNEPLVQGTEGWISNFHHALQVRLRQLMGGEVTLWRDAKLNGNDLFGDKLVERLPRVALLVSILSPRYVKSEWCMREVEEFAKAAEQTGGVRFGDRLRIFMVIKTPVPIDQQPQAMQGSLGYAFYDVDAASGRPREYSQGIGPNYDSRYWQKLEDVAYDITESLQILRTRQIEDNGHAMAPRTSIYLAPTTSDLNGEYDAIKREFQQRGCQVLPDKILPYSGAEFRQEVQHELEQCSLSVHLVGARYGLIPEAEERSIVELQNELAIQRSADAHFSRLIWIPPTLQPEEERQKQFIDLLQSNEAAQQGADLLCTDLGELKVAIQNLLTPPRNADAPPTEGPLQIYVVCEEQDLDDATLIADALFDAGFDAITPLFEGDEAEVAADHEENVLNCDALVVHYGHASESWFRATLRQLNPLEERRAAPFKAKFLYLGTPATPQKKRFRTHQALVAHEPDPFDPQHLAPFLAALRQTNGAG